jgi:hypothetical protein
MSATQRPRHRVHQPVQPGQPVQPIDQPLPTLAEPRRRIDDLTRMLIAPDAGDVPALTAQLGLAWLEVYETEGDDDALAAGLDCLRHCLESDPEHAQRPRWSLWLGLGHAERARRQCSVHDYHRAIELIAASYTGPVLEPDFRARTAATLIGLGWERLWLIRRDDSANQATRQPATYAAVDRLITTMTPLLAGSADPSGVAWVRQVVGLAHLERYELAGLRRDLDRGVDLLATASVWDLTAGTPLVGRVGSELVNALRQQGVLDADVARLDQALAAGLRTQGHLDPDDTEIMGLLYLFQAYAYEARWQVSGDAEDLSGALASWQAVLGDDELTLADAFTQLRRRQPPAG